MKNASFLPIEEKTVFMILSNETTIRLEPTFLEITETRNEIPLQKSRFVVIPVPGFFF